MRVPQHFRVNDRRFLVSILILLNVLSGASQGFPCDGSFYFVATDRKEESKFYRLVMNEIDQTFEYTEIPLHADRKRHITCLGYNVKDRMIYGLDFNSYELLRISPDGTLTSLGIPDNLDTSFQYYAGDMTADGRRLFVVARNPTTGLDERAYSIQVNDPPAYYAGFFPIVADVPVAMSDITVDPYIGVTYGFDYISGQIVATSRNGLTTTNHSPFPIEKVKEGYGALFFDRYGQLYGLGSSSRPGGEQNTMYRINKSRGGSEKIGQAIGGLDTDGCGCPFTIEFWKTITPSEVIECQDVTINYVIENHAGIGQVSTKLSDLLPDIMQIKDLQMDNLFTVDVKSGIGTNELIIEEWTLVLGKNELTVVAELGAAEAGSYASQAHLSNLSQAFNGELLSDNPLTPAFDDPTRIEILNVNEISLTDYTWSSCNLDTLFLTVPLEGSFHWSDGSTTSIFPALQDGMYSLTVQTPCFTFIDSIEVSLEDEPLRLDLGPDKNIPLGEQVFLSFSSNAKEIQSLEWSATENIMLECIDCNTSIFTAHGDGAVMLNLTDSRGCTITDEIRIHVDTTKRIYVPNAFTPNNDGLNDLLNIYGTAGKVIYLKIFDRWGNLINTQQNLEVGNSKSGWDGTRQGEILPTGIYVWTAEIIFPDQITQQFAGTVTLIN